LSIGGWFAAGDRWLMRLPALAVGPWALAIALVLVGTRQPGRPIWEPPWTRLEAALLLGITIAAFLARAASVSSIPWLFTGDEGSAGLSAVDFVEGRQNNIFALGWFSFPALYFYIESLSVGALGQTVLAARLPSAIAGALTVAGLYAFARPAFGRGVALASTACLAAFPIHIHFSRTGLNNIWDALTLVVISAALWLAWDRNRLSLFALAGVALGLGQYFYPTARVLYAMILAWLIAAAAFDRRRLRERLPGLAILTLATLTASAPLMLFYSLHPDEYAAPLARVSILGRWLDVALEESGGRLWPIIWEQVRSSALGFSSLDLRGHFNGAPMLLPAAAGLFLLGVALALVNLTAMQYSWLLIWVVAAVATGALSQNPPASQRYLFAAPAVAILISLTIVKSAEWLKGLWPRARLWLAVAGALAVMALVASDLNFYFRVYSGSREFGDRNTEVATRVAEYLNAREPGIYVYFAGPPRMGYSTHKTIPFLVPDSIGEDIPALLTAPPEFPLTGPTAFIVLPERSTDLDFIRQRFPDGLLEIVEARDGTPLFYGYDVSPP
jgi:4-amino-4-deoxy-L-arabinose transferase-like glycosyltransferase